MKKANNLLKLRGNFDQKSRDISGGSVPNMKTNEIIDSKRIVNLINELKKIKSFFISKNEETKIIEGALIEINYNKLAAKSNRVREIFKNNRSGKTSDDTIVGIKFSKGNSKKHIITHYVSIKTIDKTIETLEYSNVYLKKEFDGKITSEIFKENKKIEKINKTINGITKTTFKQLMTDISYIRSFSLNLDELNITDGDSMVSFFDVNKELDELLYKIFGKHINHNKIIKNIVILTEKEMKILKEKSPYLVSMATKDFNSLRLNENIKMNTFNNKVYSIVPPKDDAPIIGVLDTLFSKNVYFSDWVDYREEIDGNVPISKDDYLHGTSVTSIIVDGPTLNEELQDNCGNFKVRHFGIALSKGHSESAILKKIEKIISENLDIKVWNLSLGSEREISENYISPIAERLDQLQYENDIIFVIAGTNLNDKKTNKKIGSPADSINSLVVNSVNKSDNSVANYTREGYVLDFHVKPDVSYYGGDDHFPIKTCISFGGDEVKGTSFAAPWISRKLSYLIDIMGLSKEAAKALIIDSAIGWNKSNDDSIQKKIGYGIVPIDINDIITNREDEIRFIISGVSKKYNTYNYTLPIPKEKNKYPFYSRATMAYFPNVDRRKGVDYTNTQFDFKLGRITNDNKIKSISDASGKKRLEDDFPLKESELRKFYRKWDNIKHLFDYNEEKIRKKAIPKKSYDNKLWGIEIITEERNSNNNDGFNVRFGIVVTLREMNGKNQIERFMQECRFNGWFVEELIAKEKVKLHEKLEERIKFE